jgi:small nuclear ribonucleoprotein (snRNP)-like protein
MSAYSVQGEGKMNKEDVRQMLTVIRLKEFVARKVLDKEGNMGENEKMILSKLFANREYVADMVRISIELGNDEEEVYRALLEGFDIQLNIYFLFLFKEERDRCDNCIKRLKFNMDEAIDFTTKLSGQCNDEEFINKMADYFLERYGESLF